MNRLILLILCHGFFFVQSWAINPIVTSNFTNGFGDWMPSHIWDIGTESNDGNNYLEMNVGMNSGNQGSRLVIYTQGNDWAGNYITKNVHSVNFDFFNSSSFETATIRIALSSAASPQVAESNWWVSNDSYSILPGSDWANLSFAIGEGLFSKVGIINGQPGTESFNETLANIYTLRIISSTLGDIAIGDEFYGTVGVDNIRLMAIPEPSMAPLLFGIIASAFLFKRTMKRCLNLE